LSFIWINNEIGTVQDVGRIVTVTRAARPDTHIHVDATQTVGRYQVDIGKMGIDSLSFSAHKFRGPHGIGALYLPPDRHVSSVMTGGKQERGFRGGTENVAACAAMAVALKTAHAAIAKGGAERVRRMRDALLHGLKSSIPDIIVNSPADDCAYNTISVCIPCDSRQMTEHLSRNCNICLAVGSACSKGGASSTLAALGVSETALRGSLRISLGFSNTFAECDRVLRCVTEYVRLNASME
jgi:cysteine desulfurase